MDELERYLARRIRRQKFAITIRDPAEPARWARLQFSVSSPSVFKVHSLRGSGLVDFDPGYRPHLWLNLSGSGLVDFEDRMAAAGWTDQRGGSDRGNQIYGFRRQRPPDDRPATLAAIARDAAAALLGTDQYLLTIEPFQGEEGSIGENAGVGSLLTMGGFVVTAPIVAILVALVTRSPLEVALVAGALVAIAALYLQPPFSLDLDAALVRLEMAIAESAVAELPIVGPLIALVLSLVVLLVGVWVPIVVAIVITSVL